MSRIFNSAVCAIVKNEGRYIKEWLAYHRVIGIDHIFLYDNESTDDTVEIVKPYIIEGFVTFLSWPSNYKANTQRLAYQHFFQFFASSVEWLIYLDADEFINLKRHAKVIDFLRDFDDVSGVAINWRMFGEGNETGYRPGLLINRFQRASTSDFMANRLVKTFVRAADMLRPDIHNPLLSDGKITLNADRSSIQPFPISHSDTANHDVAQINHYFVKSREEWTVKRLRGKADAAEAAADRFRPDGEFDVYNRNEEEELSIQNRHNELLAELDRIDGLLLERTEKRGFKS